MTTIASGTGSTITHALSTAGLSSIANGTIISNLAVSRDSTGSVTVVAVTIADKNAGY